MNSSKKLIYLANLRLPTEKAYGIQIANTCEAFALAGLGVTLVVPFRSSSITSNFFDYYSIKQIFKFKKLFSLDFYLPGKLNILALGLKNFISAIILTTYVFIKKPDFVYSRDELPLFLLSFLRKNLVYEAHRFSVPRKFFYRRFKKQNLKVMVITRRLRSDLLSMGFKQENILVAPDGVDLEKFNIEISKKDARNRLGLPADKKIIIYTGHLFEWKGVYTLLQGAYNFQKDREGVLFVFVGGTDYSVLKFEGKVRELALSNVLILGHKSHKEIPMYLKAADVLALPNSSKEEISKFYTSPLKLFEYMTSKRPIVASDLPSLREILNEKNSVLVESDNVEQLVAGIQKIITDQNLAADISRQSFSDVQNYTWRKRAENIFNFIDHV